MCRLKFTPSSPHKRKTLFTTLLSRRYTRYVYIACIFLILFAFWKINWKHGLNTTKDGGAITFNNNEAGNTNRIVRSLSSFTRELISSSTSSPTLKRICVVTTDFTEDDGVGVGYNSLAIRLSLSGHIVSLLLARINISQSEWNYWAQFFSNHGVHLISSSSYPFSTAGTATGCSDACVLSYAVFHALLEEDPFDVLYLPSSAGVGYFSLMAKCQGFAFAGTSIIVGADTPRLMRSLSQDYVLGSAYVAEVDFLERVSASMADYLISPFNFTVSWMIKNHWTIPERTFVHQGLLPDVTLEKDHAGTTEIDDAPNVEEKPSAAPKTIVRELIIISAQKEESSVYDLFEALQAVPVETLRTLSVMIFVFHGMLVVNHTLATSFIVNRCNAMAMPCRVIVSPNHAEMIALLRSSTGLLALVASSSTIDEDLTAYTVMELLAHKVPFIAPDTGGNAELVHPSHRKKALYKPTPYFLGSKLKDILKSGAIVPVAAMSERKRAVVWNDLVRYARSNRSSDRSHDSIAMVSVVVLYSNAEMFQLAMQSIIEQDYPADKIEVVLLLLHHHHHQDDDVPTIEHQKFDQYLEHWARRRIVSLPAKLGLAEIWHRLDSQRSRFSLTGEYMVLLDLNDWLFSATSISSLMRVARFSSADLVTAQLRNGTVDRLYFSCRGELSTLSNCIGSSSMMAKAGAIDRLGAFVDAADSWDIYSRALTKKDYRVELVPDVLFARLPSSIDIFPTIDPFDQNLRILLDHRQSIDRSELWSAFLLAIHRMRVETQFSTDLAIRIAETDSFNQQFAHDMGQLEEKLKSCQSRYSLAMSPSHSAVQSKTSHVKLFFARGHEKSGTSWLIKVLALHPKVFVPVGEFHFPLIGQHLASSGVSNPDARLQEFIRGIVTQGIPDGLEEQVEWAGEKTPTSIEPLFPNASYFWIFRDGRDVIVSLFWHHVRLGGFKGWCGPDIKNLVPEEFSQQYRANGSYFDRHPAHLLHTEECVRRVARSWAQRYRQDKSMADAILTNRPPSNGNRIFEIRYEEFLVDTDGIKEQMFSFLGLAPDEARSLSKKDYTAAGVEDIKNRHKFFRKGVAGDWVNWFHDDAKRWFKEEAGDVLIDLGYAIDNDW